MFGSEFEASQKADEQPLRDIPFRAETDTVHDGNKRSERRWSAACAPNCTEDGSVRVMRV